MTCTLASLLLLILLGWITFATAGETGSTQHRSQSSSLVCCVLPPNNSNEIALFQKIVIGFTEPMDPPSMPANFELVPPVNGTSIWTDAYTFVFTPTPGLAPLSHYTATVKASAKAQSGATQGVDFSWSFTTRAQGAGRVELYVDVQMTSVQPANATEGQIITIGAVVGNRGNVSVNMTEIVIAIDSPATPIMRTIAPVPAGGIQRLEAKWQATLGNHQVLIAVDPVNATGDPVPWNNFHQIGVNVAPRPPGGLPDLLILEFNVSPTPLVEGGRVEISARVVNIGADTVYVLTSRLTVDGKIWSGWREERLLPVRQWNFSSAWGPYPPESPPVLPAGTHRIEFEVDVFDGITEEDESNNRVELIVEVLPGPPRPPAPTAPAWYAKPEAIQGVIAGSVVGVGLAALAFGASTETGKYAMFSALLPLFTRIRREKVLDHFVRGQIYEHIKRDPGVHYNELLFKMNLSNGVLAHHLRTLEMQGFVQSQRLGMYRCFYPIAMKMPRGAGVRFSDVQLKLIARLRENPGMSQMQIAKELEVSQQVTSYNLKVLARHGALRTARPGDVVRYYLEEETAPSPVGKSWEAQTPPASSPK